MFYKLFIIASLLLMVRVAPNALGANVYWDTNGTTTGAGGTSPSGTWDASATRWNSSSAGTGSVAAWAAGNVAFFSAGTDATGSYTVTVAGAHNIAGLTFEDGAATLEGGTLNWTTAGNINVAASRTSVVNSVMSGSVAVAKIGTGILRLGGTTANTLSADFTVSVGTLELAKTAGVNAIAGNLVINSTSGVVTTILNADEQIADTATVTVNSTSTSNYSTFRLNGFTETIGGLTLTTVTGAGAQVLTGSGGRLIVNGNLNFNNNRSATTGNSARDILITGTGTDGTAAPNTGYLDLGGGVRTITVSTTSVGANAVDTDATIETIIENGGIIKEGARILVLSGDNTYTGGTTINAGTIRVGAGGTTGSLLGNILNNAALEFNRSNLSTFAGDISGTGTLAKLGAGILVLSGNNTYSGLTTITAGAIRGDLGTGNLLLNGGVYEGSGTLNIGIGSGDGQVRWGVGTNGGFSAYGGQYTVSLSSGLQLLWDANTEFVNGTGQLLFGSTGADNVVDLVNSIDLNGAARTVQVLDNTSSTADKAVLSGVLSGTGASGLAKTGAGTLELRGINTFEGALTVSAGILQFSQNGNLGGTGSNAVTLSGGNLQYIGSSSNTFNGTIAVTASSTISNVGGGDLTLSSITPIAGNLTLAGTGVITFSNTFGQALADRTITITNTGGVFFNNIALTESSTAARTMVFNVAAGSTATINGVIANGTTQSSAFRLDGAGSVIVLTTPTFTNELRLNNGTLVLRANMGGQTSTNSLVFSNTAVAGSEAILNLDGSGVVYNLTGAVVYAANGGVTGSAAITGSGTLSLNGATRTFDVRPSDGTDEELVVSVSIINGSAAAGITKTRNGTLVLAGENSYTGTTTISEGAIKLDYRSNVGSKIASAGALTMNGGTLELVGNTSTAVTQTAAGYTVGQGANRIIVNDNGGPGMTLSLGALTSTAAGRSLDIVINGALASVKTPGWAVTNGILGGWATFNSSKFATVDVNGNIVAASASAKDDVSTWATDENVTDVSGYTGSTLSLAKINSLVFQSAGSAFQITDTLDITSGGIVSGASAGGNSISGGRLTTVGNAFFIHQFNTSTALTISSLISGTASITKAGEGELILNSASNSYTGTTYINKGTLTVNGGNAIGDSSAVNLDAVTGVTLNLLADETIGSLTGGGTDGGVVMLNGQTLTLNNGSTFSGRFSGTGTIVKLGTTNLTLNTVTHTGFTGTVMVNQGLVNLTGNGIANMTNATLWKLNSGGGLLIDNNSSTSAPNRVGDTAAIVMNSANGLSGTALPYRGLWKRTDQNGSRTETVGAITLDSGSSYSTLEASTNVANTLSLAQITAASLTRNNHATFNVRGTNLGTSSTVVGRTFFRLATAAELAFTTNNHIGGGGAALSSTISIVPWAVGQDLGWNLLSTTVNNQRGNSFVTYVAGIGFRPLNLTSEYSAFAAAGATSNVRETFSANVSGLAGKTINSLVLDNSSATTAATITGSGSLVVTSGAFLFTAVDSASATFAELASPQGITLNGFSDITVGPTVGSVGNEFIFHVANSAAAGVTITSNLINSTAGNTALTKSGIGTLILTGNNTYSGTTTLNEGVLEIDGWESIGGASGSAAIVFAGGTLRLQAGFTGALNRTGGIALADAGGTVDTNGVDVVFNTALVDVAGMSGGLTKKGLGTLTLGAASSYTGTTTVLEGVLRGGINQAIGTGDLVVSGGTLDLQTFSANVRRVTLNGTNAQILGNGSLTSNGSVFDLQSGTVAVNLTGTSKLVKTTAGLVTVAGVSSYTGDTLISEGVLRITSASGLSTGSMLELNGGVLEGNGTFSRSMGTGAGQFIMTGGSSGFSSYGGTLMVSLGSVNWGTFGFNPSALVLNASTADGLLNWATNLNLNGAVRTINVQASTALLSGIVADGSGSGGLTKTGAGTLEYDSVNTYTGVTNINAGVLKFNVNQNLSGAVQFGSANNITTAGKLDLSTASAQFSGMVVQTNSDANTNELVIGAGQKLVINGAVAIGSNAAAATTTLFKASGDGEFEVNNTASGALFQVGGVNTGSGQANRAIADFGDLAKMTVNLNTTNGVFRVNPSNSNNVSNRWSTLTLAKETKITAATLAVGDGGVHNGVAGQVNTIILGSTKNEFNVNTINIGTGNRDMGAIRFDAADTTGTLRIRGAAGGTSRAAFNMASAGGGTGAGGDGNLFDVRGHDVDLLFGATVIGTQNRFNAYTNDFRFDTGRLQMTSLTLSGRTGGSTTTGASQSRNVTSTMDIGGGVVIIDNGILSLASVAGSYDATLNPAPVVTGIINISGGEVTVGQTSNNSVVMGANTATSTGNTPQAVAQINITGGKVTMLGNIVRGNTSGAGLTAGAVSATVTLDGGELDMSGRSIGTSAALINFVLNSGTLRNLGQYNGGATVLDKNGSGLLKVGGVVNVTGGININGGSVELLAGSNLGGGNVAVNNSSVLAGNGNVWTTTLNSGSIRPGEISGNQIGKLVFENGLIVKAGPAATPNSVVMQIRGATGTADLSQYSVAELPEHAGELVFEAMGDHDHINVVGELTWEAGTGGTQTTKIVVEDLGVNYSFGMVFNLFDWSGMLPSDFLLPTGPYAGGAGYDLVLPDLGSSGFLWDVSLFREYGAVVVVPEPGRMMLFAVGLVTLVMRRRRK